MAQCGINHIVHLTPKIDQNVMFTCFIYTYCLGPIEFQIEFTYTFQTHAYSITPNITVFVTDVNDNIPEFEYSTNSFSFTEDLKKSSLIGFVSAFDKDSNPFNCIGKLINHIFTPLDGII